MEVLVKGKKSILFSAPHCVDHYRNGKVKVHEINTDTLVKELNLRQDVSAIYKIESLNEDANWDEISAYKQKCEKFVNENDVRYFIDIHGMDYKRKQDICIGTAFHKNTNGDKEIIKKVKEAFIKFGYKNVTVDFPFSANNTRCVSRYINKKCGIVTFQIEINNKYRFPMSDEYDMEKLISCFEYIINNIFDKT